MSRPTQQQLQEVFTSLVGNGLDFFVRSAHELETEQKFAIAHFATGLELILKARLFHEHWTLIATEPHRCAWTSVKDGTVRTLQASDLCAAITTTTGTALIHESRAFKAIFDHRNRVLHWTPQDDLADTVAEQCLAWHHLHELLTSMWADTFDGFRIRINEVECLLRDHRAYLEVSFQQLESVLKGPEHAGLVVLCPSCKFRAGVAEDGPGRVVPFECHLCRYGATAIRTDYGVLEHREQSAILDELDPMSILSPKESLTYTPDRGCCGECFEYGDTVARDGDAYVCVACGARFETESFSTCECCDQRWFGWSSEDSFYTGCEHCDGCGGGRD
jgi:hypothetical protein